MPVLFDASIYIAAMRPDGDSSQFLQRRADEAPLWLSSVSRNYMQERVEPQFARLSDWDLKSKRVLVPNLSDWASAGKLLARLAAKYGYERIGRAGLTNDALIAMSAARAGITVLTGQSPRLRSHRRVSGFLMAYPRRFEGCWNALSGVKPSSSREEICPEIKQQNLQIGPFRSIFISWTL